MSGTFDHLSEFLFDVWSHTATLAAGCVLTVLLVLFQKYVLKRPLSWRVDLAVFASFVFFASFQAWHDQYQRVETVWRPAESPRITVNVPPAQFFPQPKLELPRSASAATPITFRKFAIEPGGGLAEAPANAEGRNNPGVEIVVTAEREISYPAFQASCDNPCIFSFGLLIMGPTKFEKLPGSNPRNARVAFSVPAVWSKGKQIAMDFRSTNGQPLAVRNLRLLDAANMK